MAGVRVRQPVTSMNDQKGGDHMLWTIAVVLVILWLLGLVSGYTLGNFIHILLVIAIIVVVLQVIQGRRPV
jgi:predicted ferric reductase